MPHTRAVRRPDTSPEALRTVLSINKDHSARAAAYRRNLQNAENRIYNLTGVTQGDVAALTTHLESEDNAKRLANDIKELRNNNGKPASMGTKVWLVTNGKTFLQALAKQHGKDVHITDVFEPLQKELSMQLKLAPSGKVTQLKEVLGGADGCAAAWNTLVNELDPVIEECVEHLEKIDEAREDGALLDKRKIAAYKAAPIVAVAVLEKPLREGDYLMTIQKHGEYRDPCADVRSVLRLNRDGVAHEIRRIDKMSSRLPERIAVLQIPIPARHFFTMLARCSLKHGNALFLNNHLQPRTPKTFSDILKKYELTGVEGSTHVTVNKLRSCYICHRITQMIATQPPGVEQIRYMQEESAKLARDMRQGGGAEGATIQMWLKHYIP